MLSLIQLHHHKQHTKILCAILQHSTRSIHRYINTVPIGAPHPTQQDTNSTQLTSFFIHGSLLQLLSSQAIGIGCQSNNVTILQTPTQFYDKLIELTQQSQSRIILSSLYLGTGTLEQKLIGAIQLQCSKYNSLHVGTLFDYLRGTRHTKSGTTVDTLKPLLQSHCTLRHNSNSNSNSTNNRIKSSFFHVPLQTHRWWHRLLSGRTREALGVHHMKYYIFDDYIVLSGANLSDTYFTNRQDRYILIKNKQLADFYTNVTNILSNSNSTYIADQYGILQRNQPNDNPRLITTQQQLIDELQQHFIPSNTDLKPGMNSFHSNYSPHIDCWIFPTIQCGTLNIRHDESITESLINFTNLQRMTNDVQTSQIESTHNESAWSDRGKLDISTGYMNFTKRYSKLIYGSIARIRLISSSYIGNGWYGAPGIYKFIPDLYTSVTYQFIKQLSNQPNIRYYEYNRENWSYHCKGIWYTASGQSIPNVTLIGSSNFGQRSVNTDTESSIILVSQYNNTLCQQLLHERDDILSYSKLQSIDEFTSNPLHKRALNPFFQWIGRIAKYYM